MILEDYILRLAKDLNIENIPKKDENNVVHLEITDKKSIYLQDLNSKCYCWAVLETVPKANNEDLFLYLMKANLLFQATGNSSIGMDEGSKYFIFSTFFDYEWNYREFKEALEDFFNYFIYWQEEIKKSKEEQQNKLLK